MSHISVIIPNYNRATLVGHTIENMLGQSLAPDEVIVVDDGSTDDSQAVVRSFGSRVKLIVQENRGPGTARNTGFAASTGDFIQFMDSDDLASRNKLEVQYSVLQTSNADFAYCPWVRTIISGKKLEFSGPVMQSGPLPGSKSMLEWRMGTWCLVLQNCLFRRAILEKAGKFRTDLMPSEDSEYLVRILLAKALPIFTSECLIFYRTHNLNQITSSGTSARKRAEDCSLYLQVVGNQVAAEMNKFRFSTKLEIALNVYRHNCYCRKNGWPTLDSASPFARLTSAMPAGCLVVADFFDRLVRKLSNLRAEVPNSRGIVIRPPNGRDFKLAEEIGFESKGLN
jgi:glycosyltransferase involved in cell wall biosynthesis